MKNLAVLALITISAMSFTSALAADKVSTITCNVKEENDGKQTDVKVEFLIQNLGSKKAELVQHPEADEDMGAILVLPDNSDASNLNGQGGDLRVSDDKILLFGDGDGYVFVDLVLFKNSDYKSGYMRVYGSANQSYQKINCSVK